ncbi:hypothetical protein BDV3_000726 [Batrachochytrium dendrobatidis]|uniref:THO complex subunit 2 n=1 Tax=Batrachochytrium dendrobatidis (strain JEL423) TaxID=403673 RepID=A0A177W8L4_BATDL|nr:hypothetical protein BDEG_20289 [Batrachochytrium dendrobatidis JEL423]
MSRQRHVPQKLLTKDIIAHWSTHGRTTIFDKASHFFVNDKTADPALASTRMACLRSLLYEAIISVIQEQLSPIQVAEFCYLLYTDVAKHSPGLSRDSPFGYVGASDTHEPLCIPSILIDVISMLDVSPDVRPGSTTTDHTKLIGQRRSRLVDFTKQIIARDFIPVSIFIERLEIEFLGLIGIIANAAIFGRKIIRSNTALLYKQNKFNLLREESEGYSKLLIELTCDLPQPLDIYWAADKGRKSHSDLAILRNKHICERTLIVIRNIQSLIGSFDLDPNRVLDIILDVFIANVLDYWDFFIELLLQGPWKPRTVKQKVKKLTRASDSSEIIEEEVEVETLVGRDMVGQILGFKFQFYNSSEAAQPTPQQLVWVSAILIKHKMVQLSQLYPHLSSADSTNEADFEEYCNELKVKCSTAGRYATSSLSGTLGEDGTGLSAPITSKETIQDKPTNSRLPDQKSALAAALIAIGDLTSARKILDRLPHLATIYLDIPENMCRVLQVVVEDIDCNLRPLHSSRITRKQVPSLDKFPPPVNTLLPKLQSVFDTVHVGRKMQPPRQQFFYQLWKDGIPRAFDYPSAFRVIKTLLVYVGPNLHLNHTLLSKIIRIGRAHIEHSKMSDVVMNGWLSVVSNHIFPALSQTHSNPGLAQDVWSLVKLWPYTTRYALYGEWKHVTYKKIPELAVAQAGCQKDCRYIMARLSKETMKQYGRHIAKVAHSNPVIAFSYILKQLESYDNMIPVVVDASRYLTDLEFDVMSFCLIEALSDRRKQRVEENGTYISPWLKALSSFTGMLLRRHEVDMTGMLQYIANQLASDNVYDLIVLQDIIISMSGIKPLDDATEHQLDALAGGETVRREALILESLRLTRKPTSRLVDTLVQSQLAMPIGMLIARQRKEIIFRTNTDELKILGWLNDYCQCKFLLYFDFLSCNLSIDVYSKDLATLDEMVGEFGLDMEVAFHILRPVLSHVLRSCSIKLAKQSLTQTSASDADSNHALLDNTPAPGLDDKMDVDPPSNKVAAQSFLDINHQSFTAASSLNDNEVHSMKTLASHPLLAQLATSVSRLLPSYKFSDMSPSFYVTFWQLSLYDIFVPIQRYQAEIARQQQQIALLEADRSDMSSAAVTKRKQEKERKLLLQQKLTKELKTQQDNYDQTRSRLNMEKMEWFAQNNRRSEAIHVILEMCLYPRALLSPSDAIYCGKFISLIHSLGTMNLSTVSLYDNIFSKDCLHATIFALTEVEAKNYGLFLAVNLQILSIWHAKKSVYEKEGQGDGLPGFLCRWPTGRALFDRAPKDDIMNYEQFRRAMSKWHLKLRKAFLDALQSQEYVQIRNAILILDKLIDNFPATKEVGISIQKVVKNIEDTETRSDLKQLARSYFAKLYSKEKHWISVTQFSDQHLQQIRAPTAPVASTPSARDSKETVPSLNAPTIQSSKNASASKVHSLPEKDSPLNVKNPLSSTHILEDPELMVELGSADAISVVTPTTQSTSLAHMDIDDASTSGLPTHQRTNKDTLLDRKLSRSTDGNSKQSRGRDRQKDRDRDRESGQSSDTLPLSSSAQHHERQHTTIYSRMKTPERHRNDGKNGESDIRSASPAKLDRLRTIDSKENASAESGQHSTSVNDPVNSGNSWRKQDRDWQNEREGDRDGGRNRDRDSDRYSRGKDRDRHSDSTRRGTGSSNYEQAAPVSTSSTVAFRRDGSDRRSGHYDANQDGKQWDRSDTLSREAQSSSSAEFNVDASSGREGRDRNISPANAQSGFADRQQARRDGRGGRENKDTRDGYEGRESRDNREGRESRDARSGRNNHDFRDDRDNRDGRERDNRDGKETREPYGSRLGRDNDESRSRKDGRNREGDFRDTREPFKDSTREGRNRDDRDRRDQRDTFPRQGGGRSEAKESRPDTSERHSANDAKLQQNGQGNGHSARNEHGDRNNRHGHGQDTSAGNTGRNTSISHNSRSRDRSPVAGTKQAVASDQVESNPLKATSVSQVLPGSSVVVQETSDISGQKASRDQSKSSSVVSIEPGVPEKNARLPRKSKSHISTNQDSSNTVRTETAVLLPSVPASATSATAESALSKSTILDRLGGRSHTSLQNTKSTGSTISAELDRRKRSRDDVSDFSSRRQSGTETKLKLAKDRPEQIQEPHSQIIGNVDVSMPTTSQLQNAVSGTINSETGANTNRGSKRVKIVRK